MQGIDYGRVCNCEIVYKHVERSLLLLEPSTKTLHKCLQLSWQNARGRDQEKTHRAQKRKETTHLLCLSLKS